MNTLQTVVCVHTRVSDLYNNPFNQLEQQMRLSIESIKERQEWELINNRHLGLLESVGPGYPKYEHFLTEYAREHLAKIDGLRLIGNPRERVSVVSFILKDIPTPEVGRLLDKDAGIALRSGHHCAQLALRRLGVEATVRPSFSFYNTTDEIDKLVEAVRKIRFNR